MIVVAGPSGSGKSTAFPVSETGVDYFNVDDRAAVLNGGSYRNIPPEIRAQANRECEEFIVTSIRERQSFAVETTLRGDITFEQAQQARAHGFTTEMTYVALDSVERNIKRVTARGQAGGHAASPGRIRAIHRASLGNLARALREFDRVWVYDNSVVDRDPELVLEARGSALEYVAKDPPGWLKDALCGTEYDLAGTAGLGTL